MPASCRGHPGESRYRIWGFNGIPGDPVGVGVCDMGAILFVCVSLCVCVSFESLNSKQSLEVLMQKIETAIKMWHMKEYFCHEKMLLVDNQAGSQGPKVGCSMENKLANCPGL